MYGLNRFNLKSNQDKTDSSYDLVNKHEFFKYNEKPKRKPKRNP